MEDRIMLNPKFIVIAYDFDNGDIQALGIVFNTLENAVNAVLRNFKAHIDGELTKEQENAYRQELMTHLFLGKDDVEQEIDWTFKIEMLDTELEFSLEKITETTTLYTINQFNKMVDHDVFNEDDGYGYYANRKTNQISNLRVSLNSLFDKDFLKEKGLTHIAWFNR